MKSLFASAALLALSSGTVLAADLPVYQAEAVVAPVAHDWTGVYVGLQAGYSWNEADYNSDVSIVGFTILTPEGSYDLDGFVGGVYGGANYQFGNIVVGVDSSLSYSDADGGRTDEFGTEIDRDLKWLGTTRGRIGYAFDRFMVFAAGGAAIGESETSLTTGFGSSSDTEVHLGWTVGAGVEAKLADSWSVRAEYLYVDLGDEDYDLDVAPLAIESSSELQMHIVRVGIAYHF